MNKRCVTCVFWHPIDSDRTGACERTVVRIGEPQYPDSDAIARHDPHIGMAYLETTASFGCTQWTADLDT